MNEHIDTYIGFFLTSRQAAGRSPKTIQSYRWHLGVFRSWAEDGSGGTAVHPTSPRLSSRILPSSRRPIYSSLRLVRCFSLCDAV